MKSFDIANLLDLPDLPKYSMNIQAVLENTLPEPGSPMFSPLKQVIAAPSKRLRSGLLIASLGPAKPVDKKVLNACAAIELIHLASLVHDDIMDNAATRWNVPTIHKKDGLNQAILVGDYLFAKANLLAASVSPQVATAVANTIAALCEGQAREMADINNLNRTLDSYLVAIAGKTGSLIAASCEVGALTGGLDDKLVEALRSFGESFGMTFQLVDDILDLLSSTELMGKPVGNDVAEGVYTMPVLLGLHGPSRQKILLYLGSVKKFEAGGRELLFKGGHINETVKEIKKFNQNAAAAVKDIARPELAGLPTAYLSWALENLVQEKYRSLITTT